MMGKSPAADSDVLVGIDAAIIAVVSTAICLWSRYLLLMTILVPAVIFLRMALLYRMRANLKAEGVFLIVCIMLGAFNDWNSVVNHQIYQYSVPHYFGFSSIPIWMLLFWGMILRFFARLARWERLNPPLQPENRIGVGRFKLENAGLRIALLLLLTFVTRQFIYRNFLDPVWSWLPFLVAILVYLILLYPKLHDMKLLGVFLIGGPAIEILYIQVGGLHLYHLGWIWGVPLWIALWWMLAIMIWKDLSFRLESILQRIFSDK